MAFPVALGSHPVGCLELGCLAAQRVVNLPLRPDVRRALFAVRVRVEARDESTVGRRHLAPHEAERLLNNLSVASVARELPSVGVRPCQQRVVVEHLFEVRHQPMLVGRITGEAATKLVVDAAGGHRVEAPPGHRQRPLVGCTDVLSEQELDGHRLRELGRPAPAAVARVKGPLQTKQRGVEHPWLWVVN